jgi:hypothetical protein
MEAMPWHEGPHHGTQRLGNAEQLCDVKLRKSDNQQMQRTSFIYTSCGRNNTEVFVCVIREESCAFCSTVNSKDNIIVVIVHVL